MKRCPVLVHLALVLVALFADDARCVAQLRPLGGHWQSVQSSDSSSLTPQAAVGLANSEGPLAEVVPGGRMTRDVTVRLLFPEPLHVAGLLVAQHFGSTPAALSSLVAEHTRLQI